MTRTDLIDAAVAALRANEDPSDAVIDAAVEGSYDLNDGEIDLIVEAAKAAIDECGY